MKFLKKAAALFVAAAVSLTTALSAFAQSGESPAGGKSIDIYSQQYSPIDKTKLVKWNGKDAPAENTSYYIDSEVKIPKDAVVSFPETSTLVLCEGANLQVYKEAKLYSFGTLIVEPRARLTVSGTAYFKKTGASANYGTIVSTASSTVNISSPFVIHANSSFVMSGQTNVFQTGNITNYGTVTFSPNSVTMLTGTITNAEEAKFFDKGKITVTLSGKMAMNGRFSLMGSLVVSGTLILEKPVKFFIGEDSVFTTSKSARITDYRPDATLDIDEDLRNKGTKGIDVSEWQEAINWKKVKNAGIQFAMIRASLSENKVDKTFEYNITEATKAGLDVGVYHYCYAMDAEEARTEARHFIETISPYKITYPVVLDFEDNSQVKLDNKVKNEIAQVFIEEIRNAGYYPMIYSYSNWYEKYMDMDKLDCEVWIAHWGVIRPTYKGSYGIWQYSSEGRVSGIDGDVDLNVCFKDYAKIIREGGYNNLSKFN